MLRKVVLKNSAKRSVNRSKIASRNVPSLFNRKYSDIVMPLDQAHLIHKLNQIVEKQNDNLPVTEKRALLKSPGYCLGLTAVVMNSLWLEHHPVSPNKKQSTVTRKDLQWLEPQLTKIAHWNHSVDSCDDENINWIIDKVGAVHTTRQQWQGYTFAAALNYLCEENHFVREYVLVAPFTVHSIQDHIQLTSTSKRNQKPVAIADALLQEDKILTVSNLKHINGLYQPTSEPFFYCYDANNPKGIEKIDNDFAYGSQGNIKDSSQYKAMFIATGLLPLNGEYSTLRFVVTGEGTHSGEYPEHGQFVSPSLVISTDIFDAVVSNAPESLAVILASFDERQFFDVPEQAIMLINMMIKSIDFAHRHRYEQCLHLLANYCEKKFSYSDNQLLSECISNYGVDTSTLPYPLNLCQLSEDSQSRFSPK